MKVLCRTLFDCTHTGVTGHFRAQQLPYTTKGGLRLETVEDWNHARNQQRNWETIMQMISLRAQPTIVEYPVCADHEWRFVFEVETPGVYSADGSIDNLDENTGVKSCLIVHGQDQNIWFETIHTSLE